MKRAAIYARYSTDLQSERSIEDQFVLCREKAKREQSKVIAEFEDRAKSGVSTHGRDGIKKLMEAAKAGTFDILIVESLDRLSRDQEDMAAIFKKLTFYGIDIISVHEGRADQMQVGVRGIVSAFYLSDLAHKVRRGAAGNIREGKHAGGLAYGYRTTPGKPGEWVIDEPEAEVIRSIYAKYASGMRSRQIIDDLNKKGVKPPRGEYWQPGALTGSNNRHNGILGNEIYCGRLVWNKVRMLKDPETRKRISRPNPESEWHRAEARHLQIITPQQFGEVARIRQERRNLTASHRRKPKRLLSGLLRCAVCGGGMSIKGEDRGGTRVICTQFHNSRTCANNRTYYLDQIEQAVLSGLRKHLIDPSAIRLFLQTYLNERKRLVANANNVRPHLERKLGEIERQIGRLTEALMNSHDPVSQFTGKISDLNAMKQQILIELQDLREPVTVSLHPTTQQRYLSVVENLAVAIRDNRMDSEMVAAVRELIDHVIVERTEPGKPVHVKVNGRLATLIGEPLFPESSLSGVKMVAREGLEPPTPRL
ncbi:recombinase family protein [Bradyrhizobium sp. AZCC 2289]|uniref:recombinase family protein n=1 Tax=Bradyrhizobium sp. AZCC 2289 TaxID=3117026 RepID=UPI002FF3CDC3